MMGQQKHPYNNHHSAQQFIIRNQAMRYSEVILSACRYLMKGFADNGSCRAASPFEAGAVVHGLSESLCAAQVPLGGLDGHVAEQKLNLLQLAACCVAETSTCAAVMPNAAGRGF
jgi:hypothetical protein